MSETEETYVYGIVFGYKNTSMQDALDAEEWIKYNKDDMIQNNGLRMSTRIPKEFVDTLSEFVTLAQSMNDLHALTYHNGYTDPEKQFQGPHWHMIVLVHKKLCNMWIVKKIRKKCSKTMNTIKAYFDQTVEVHKMKLLQHVIKPPRVIIYLKQDILEEGLGVATDINEVESTIPEGEAAQTMKFKRPKHAARLDKLKKLYLKYGLTDINSLYRACVSEVDLEAVQWLDNQMEFYDFEKLNERVSISLHNGMLNYSCSDAMCMDISDNPKRLSVEASTKLLMCWFSHHGISPNEFIKNLFDVLYMRSSKYNAFVLWGVPNAGKTFVLSSIKELYPLVGEPKAKKGNLFSFQNCINKNLLYIDELHIRGEHLQTWKLILEGRGTLMEVKHRDDQLYHPVPILGTANHEQTEFLTADNDIKALHARIRFYELTKPYDLLAKFDGRQLHPYVWRSFHERYIEHYPLEQAKESDEALEAILDSEYNKVKSSFVGDVLLAADTILEKKRNTLTEENASQPNVDTRKRTNGIDENRLKRPRLACSGTTGSSDMVPQEGQTGQENTTVDTDGNRCEETVRVRDAYIEMARAQQLQLESERPKIITS